MLCRSFFLPCLIVLVYLLPMNIVALGQTNRHSLPHYPRLEICLNGNWDWMPGGEKDGNIWARYDNFRVPGACQRDDLTQEVAVWYRKSFSLPSSLRDDTAQWYLRFEKAGWYTRAYINGKEVGENFGSFVPFEFDITEALRWGQSNELKVFLHVASGKYVLPGKEVKDLRQAMSFRSGGRRNINWAQIEGDVTLHKRPVNQIDFYRAETSVRNKELRIKGTMQLTEEQKNKDLHIHAQVFDLHSHKLELENTFPINTESTKPTFDSKIPWRKPVLWGFGKYGKPHLYGLRLELLDKQQNILDAVTSRFGFREVWYEGQTLMLNGKPLFISAAVVPLHKSYDVVYHHTYALFERNQIVRHMQALRAHGRNGIHNHFDTYGTALYDVADELGFLVLPGCFCSGPRWKAGRTECHEDWPLFMHNTFANWAREVGGHPSVVMWSLICGTPGETKDMPLGKMLKLLDHGGAIHETDTTRPIMGVDNDIVKEAFGGLRGVIEKTFTDDSRPHFVQEVWGFEADNPVVLQHTQGLLQWLKDKNVSGYVTYGQTYPLFEFNLNWPSNSGYGVRWSKSSPQFPRNQFTGWLNWCDPSKPLTLPTELGRSFRNQYKQLWGSPGDTTLKVHPHILSSGHEPDAHYLALTSDEQIKPAPRLILLDQEKTGYVNVLYPGQLRLYEIGMEHQRTQTVEARRKKMNLKPGYPDIIQVKWNGSFDRRIR